MPPLLALSSKKTILQAEVGAAVAELPEATDAAVAQTMTIKLPVAFKCTDRSQSFINSKSTTKYISHITSYDHNFSTICFVE